jgi:tRNA pseudouridine55 synthase
MAKEIDQLDPSDLLPLSDAISHVPHILLDDREAQGVREGRPFMLAQPPAEPVVAFLDSLGRVMGMGRVHGNMVQPECVIPAEMMPSMVVS